MNRKQKIAAGVWAALIAIAFGWFWFKLDARRRGLEDVEAAMERCGELRLGMDETEAVQLMGSVESRAAVAPSTPGVSDLELRFGSPEPGLTLQARLDGRSGRLVEADCGSSYRLKADDAYLRTLAPGREGVGTDSARP